MQRPASRVPPADPEPATAYAVGVIHHQSYADLDACLTSVAAQHLAPARIVVIDVDGDAAERERLRRRHPRAVFEAHANRGYAGAANSVLARAREPFVLLLNADIALEPEFAGRLLAETAARPEVALACGKLLRPDAGAIDSAGIVLPRHRRPRDRGSEEPDRGQYDRTEYVFGAGGAALLLRAAALADLAIEDEIFDEDFFIYHEDTDLSWRANLLGWRVLYVPDARAVHGRRWRRAQRFEMPVAIRRHSFKNHYLQLLKNERARDLWLDLPALAGWELLRLGFALLRDRAVLAGYRDAWRLAGRAWHKRRILQRRVRERRGARPPRTDGDAPRAAPAADQST